MTGLYDCLENDVGGGWRASWGYFDGDLYWVSDELFWVVIECSPFRCLDY